MILPFSPYMRVLGVVLLLTACQQTAPSCPDRPFLDSGADGWEEFTCLAQNEATDLGPAHSVKLILLSATSGGDIHYIPSTYKLHYDYAHARWPQQFPTRELFDQIMYWDKAHPHVNATLVHYPEWSVRHAAPSAELPAAPTWTAPMTLQFFTSDVVPLPVVVATYKRVLATVGMLPATGEINRLVYIPANSQAEAEARQAATALEADGVLWATEAELYATVRQQSMNPGVTFGTLREVSADQLTAGGLSYRDVIVLARLPLDLPLVGGTITAEMQTPLAHVNVVAKARNTPNLALRDANRDPRVQPLLGRLVRFAVFPGGFELREATAAEVNAYWQQRLAREPFVPAADLAVTAVRDLDQLDFDSAVAYGVKCANYAELRKLWRQEAATVRALTHGARDSFTEPGLGVPFAAYEQHILQNAVAPEYCAPLTADCAGDAAFSATGCADAGKLCAEIAAAGTLSIKAYIAAALARPDFVADSFLRAAALRGFRWLIEHAPLDPGFAATLDAAAWGRFTTSCGGFCVTKHDFRMRSSTNAEDLDGFTGAGLYESFTAQVEGKKRASAQIRKVWGSVWTFRAFEERSFWRIDHLAVRMGVLMNPNHPNEIANGVIITRNLADPESWGFYVNAQLGEHSVTNPRDGITPEVFTLLWQPAEPAAFAGHMAPLQHRLAFSSLSPTATVLPEPFPEQLLNALLMAQAHFAPLYGHGMWEMALDSEWKVHPDADGKPYFLIKQIRPF